MAYLDIISLIEAKNYLRVDSDLTDDDEVMQVTGYANTEWVKPEDMTGSLK